MRPSRASLRISAMLPGVHRVRRKLADGRLVAIWYAWRGGGPVILRAEGRTDRELQAEIERLAPSAAVEYSAKTRSPEDKTFLAGLITRYLTALESPEFSHLSKRTKADRVKSLGRVKSDLGHMELKALAADKARSVLLHWRDTYSATPRTADGLLGDLSLALTWAHDHGELGPNPVKDFPRIYESDRSAIIWTPQDLAALLPECSLELRCAVMLASHTGARLGDLRALTWSGVGEHAVTWQTQKSRGRRTVVVPITDALRSVMAEIPRVDAVNILTSRRKKPWSEAGLESALRKARIAADKKLAKRGDPRRIRGLRWHDLRGTAATNMIRAGTDLRDVASILGWLRKSPVATSRARQWRSRFWIAGRTERGHER